MVALKSRFTVKIRLGGSRRKAGAVYGIEQIRASRLARSLGGRRERAAPFPPGQLVELPRFENGKPHTIFLLDNLPARSARKVKSGIHMFATIVGGALTLVFIGLPLAIIGLFIQSLLERRNKRPVIGYGKSKPIGSEHQLERARPESESAPSQLPNAVAPGHRPGLATPIVARHHDARTSASARDHGRGERRGTIPDRHSAIAAPASPADRPAQASARDRRA
jgi:hypothetical protein